MAISDAIDGYWARHRKQITKLGTFLDPLADKLLITCASLLLVSQRGHVEGFLLPMTVVVLIIGKDILITIGFLVMYLITSQRAHRAGVGGQAGHRSSTVHGDGGPGGPRSGRGDPGLPRVRPRALVVGGRRGGGRRFRLHPQRKPVY